MFFLNFTVIEPQMFFIVVITYIVQIEPTFHPVNAKVPTFYSKKPIPNIIKSQTIIKMFYMIL